MVVSRLLGAGHGVKRAPATKQPPAALAWGHFLSPEAGAPLPSLRFREALDADLGPYCDGHDHHARSPCLHHAAARFSGVSTPLASARIIHVKPHRSATQPPWM